MHRITLTTLVPEVPDVAEATRQLRAALESWDRAEISTDLEPHWNLVNGSRCQTHELLGESIVTDLELPERGPIAAVRTGASSLTIEELPERGPIAAVRISAGKVVERVSLSGFGSFQHHVAGKIEGIELDDGSRMYANEEGRLHNLPPNSIATDLCLANGLFWFARDMIRGDVLVVGPGDGRGNDTSVTGRQEGLVAKIHAEAI